MTAQTDNYADDVDLIAVERACGGDHSVALNRAEAFAAWQRLEAQGCSANEISALLGVTDREIQRWRSGAHNPVSLRAGRRMTSDHADTLYRSNGITDKRIQRAAGKAREALNTLAGLLDDWDRKAEARAEVERLEEELAAAKAKLRGGYPTPQRIGPSRSVEPMACRKCGKECANGQGRAAHERHCKGIAA